MDVTLELAARKTAYSACAFMADAERELAATVLATFMRDMAEEGFCLIEVLHALSSSLLHVAATSGTPAKVFREHAAELMLMEGQT
jgi:hypothetical protein